MEKQDTESLCKLMHDTVQMHFKQYRNTPTLKEVLLLDGMKKECMDRIIEFYKTNKPETVQSESVHNGNRWMMFDIGSPNESVKVKEDGNCVVFAGNSGFECWCPEFCKMVFSGKNDD